MAEEKTKLINLDEAGEYLVKKNFKRTIWELKNDIDTGKLHAKKSEVRFWVTEQDLINAYGIGAEKITAKEYYSLKSKGWTKEEIIEKRLIPLYGKNARKVVQGFELAILRGAYKKEEEKEIDMHKVSALLGERNRLVKILAQKQQIGLVDEVRKIEEKIENREVIWCKVVEAYEDGITIQTPVTNERRTDGLYATLFDYFVTNYQFHLKLKERGITISNISIHEGFLSLACRGKLYQILHTINEHLTSSQPQGFEGANLEARLDMPVKLIAERGEKKLPKTDKKTVEAEVNILDKERFYNGDEIRRIFNRKNHPQAVGGLVIGKKISSPKIIEGERCYQILVPPRGYELR